MSNWKHGRRSNSEIYHFEVDDDVLTLQPSQVVFFTDIGGVSQTASPVECRGHRIRFGAEVCTQDTDGAGLWLMANHKDWHITDGMYDSLIKGSKDWTHIDLVIDVPMDAAYISYGLWMQGNGICRMKNSQFELVECSIPVSTDKIYDRVSAERWVERSH
jgi:hypothetical protein